MPRLLFIVTLLLTMLTSGLAVQAECRCARCCDDEPFIRFLDDLHSFPHGTCKRDPYEERMETERHDFTQSTKTVGRGVVQLEAGYLYLYKDENGEIEHSHAAPETRISPGAQHQTPVLRQRH